MCLWIRYETENNIVLVALIIFSYESAMIQERASLPVISLQPVVVGAARKTSKAVGRATKTFMNIISRREETIEEYDEGAQ